MSKNMGIDSLKSNLTNPSRLYLWEIVFPTVIGGGDSDVLMLRAQSTSKPGREYQPIHVPFKQTGGMRFNGKLDYSHIWECTFIEGEDRKVFDAIYGWLQSIIGDETGIGLGDAFIKVDLILRMITTAGEDYEQIKMKGCFPLAISDVPLAYDMNDVLKYSVRFSYDSWVRL